MARKSPITGMARPEGIIDDVIAPVSRALAKEYRQNTRRIIKSGETVTKSITRSSADKAKKAVAQSTKRNAQIERSLGATGRRGRANRNLQGIALQEERIMLQRNAGRRAAKKAVPKKVAPRKKATPKRSRRGPYGDFDSWLNDMNPRGY